MAGSDNRALAISPPPQILFSYHLFCLQKTSMMVPNIGTIADALSTLYS